MSTKQWNGIRYKTAPKWEHYRLSIYSQSNHLTVPLCSAKNMCGPLPYGVSLFEAVVACPFTKMVGKFSTKFNSH